eukprot:403191-Prymnesium_polylepis.1
MRRLKVRHPRSRPLLVARLDARIVNLKGLDDGEARDHDHHEHVEAPLVARRRAVVRQQPQRLHRRARHDRARVEALEREPHNAKIVGRRVVQVEVDDQQARLDGEEGVHLQHLQHLLGVAPLGRQVDDVPARVVRVDLRNQRQLQLALVGRVTVDPPQPAAHVDAIDGRGAAAAAVQRRVAAGRPLHHLRVRAARVGRDADLAHARRADEARLAEHPAPVLGIVHDGAIEAELAAPERLEQRAAQEVVDVGERGHVVEVPCELRVGVVKLRVEQPLAHQRREGERVLQVARDRAPRDEHDEKDPVRDHLVEGDVDRQRLRLFGDHGRAVVVVIEGLLVLPDLVRPGDGQGGEPLLERCRTHASTDGLGGRSRFGGALFVRRAMDST